MARRHTLSVSIVLSILALAAPAFGMVNAEEPDPDDTRFDAIGAFGFTRWLNGSQKNDNWWGGATLIGREVIVTAKHNVHTDQLTDGNYAVRFRRQPDGEVQHKSYIDDETDERVFPYIVPVKEWILPPSGDIAIGILRHPVWHIDPIPATLETPDVGDSLVLGGWGSESETIGAHGPRNRLLIGETTCTSAGSSFVGFPSFWGAGNPPGPNMHDSGGAILDYDEFGNLNYVGTITTYGGGTGLGQFEGTAFGEQLMVPEPATMTLLALGGLMAVRRRR